MISNIKTNEYKIIITVFFVFILTASQAHALTSLYFKTDNINIKNGDTFSVDLKISSDKPINVVDGTLTFDKTKLSVKDIKTDGSILSVWAKAPVFDNNKGTITFIGGVLGGFKNKDGEILNVSFRTKNDGQIKLDFQDVFSVYLNDGLGTKINPWLEPLQLTVNPSQTDLVIRQTVKVLADKDTEYNHIPSIILSLLAIVMLIMFITGIKKNKSVK